MSLSPAAADPPSNEDPPQFKHQVGRIAGAEGVPLVEATPVETNSSSPITISRIEERMLRLEAQLELEQQHVANLQQQQQQQGEAQQSEQEQQHVADPQQQQGRPPAPSSTTNDGSAIKCSLSPQQKRWIALGIVVAAVVVVVAVVITMVAGGPETPRRPPVEVESILSYINSITLSGRTLSYPPSTGTAEELAVQWLIEDDLKTAANDWDALRQRFALSTLWFIPTPAGFGTGYRNFTGTWITNLDECAWLDVACDDDGRVTALFLSESYLQGRIPDNLGLLTAMTSLSLKSNTLTGTIPSSLAAMTNLVVLELGNNILIGTIPSSLGGLTAMTDLGLSGNQMTGTIPSSVTALTNLKSLWLENNKMTGTILSSLVTMTALASVWFGNNLLTGTIPLSLGLLTGLEILILDNNFLTGTIPSSLGALTALTTLLLYNNQLNDTLPLCGLNRTFERLVVDCAEVSCPCCTHCCPTASEDGTIPVFEYC
jgi:Leucine rich repeat